MANDVRAINDIYRNGLNAAYGQLPRSQNRVVKTGQVTSYSAYDDGALQIGLNEPATRFEDVNIAGVNLVIDHHTGLMWGKSKFSAVNNYGSTLVWDSALSWAAGSTVAGFDDWRVANFMECLTIFNFENSLIYPNFTGFAASNKMWSCTTWAVDTSKAVQLS